jgi:hypothetical protein
MSSEDAKLLFDDVLSRAILEVRAAGIDVFTFAFYHDHESAAVSICVDTEASSVQAIRSGRAFKAKHFADAVATGNLRKAAAFKANIGRSLSLGNFEMVNVARTDIGSVTVDDNFYLEMIRAVRTREQEIVSMTRDVERLLFCSSSAELEVGFMWTAAPPAV